MAGKGGADTALGLQGCPARHPTGNPLLEFGLCLIFSGGGCKYGGQEAWHRAHVPTFPAQELRQAARICLPSTFCFIISHLMSPDSRDFLQPTSQEVIQGICHVLNSRKKQGGERV